MKVLFDQGTPVPLRRHLRAYEVATVYELGWSTLQNGALISQAEAAGFDVLITTDRNWKYQQNLKERRIAVIVLLSTSWPKIQGKDFRSVDRCLHRIPDLPWRTVHGTYSANYLFSGKTAPELRGLSVNWVCRPNK